MCGIKLRHFIAASYFTSLTTRISKSKKKQNLQGLTPGFGKLILTMVV